MSAAACDGPRARSAYCSCTKMAARLTEERKPCSFGRMLGGCLRCKRPPLQGREGWVSLFQSHF